MKTLSEVDVAAACGWNVKTLRNHRAGGDGPVAVRVSRRTTVYLESDVAEWLHSRRQAAAVKEG